MKISNNVHLIIMFFLITAILAACTSAPISSEQETRDHKGKTVPDIEKDTPMKDSESEFNSIVFKDLVPFEEFKTNSIPPGNKASYDIDLGMEEDGTFHVDTKISVENTSNDSWDTVQFYFIPNAFTEENKPEFMEFSSETEISSLMVDGKSTPYSLDYDTLEVELETPLENKEKTIVDVSYTFTVPEWGNRFSKIENNYYLAQFYPMLPTYRNGWNKMDYDPMGESYHTGFSNFIVNYEIPDGYIVYSTADDEDSAETSTETLQMNNVKEFYLAIMKSSDMKSEQETVNGTEIRVIGYNGNDLISDELATAVDSFHFYEKNIGDYPHKQLDIIMDGGGMEYPGIVMVGSNDEYRDDSVVVHEIGHQWFYGVISNDPYYDAWIDEGINEFANSIYFMENHNMNMEESFGNLYQSYENTASRNQLIAANLPLGQYYGTYAPSVYLQPSVQLHELFRNYNGNETALDFLQNYYEHYQYKEVDTEEFLNFITSYLQLEDVSVFDEWLKIN